MGSTFWKPRLLILLKEALWGLGMLAKDSRRVLIPQSKKTAPTIATDGSEMWVEEGNRGGLQWGWTGLLEEPYNWSHELWHLQDEEPGQVNFDVRKEALRGEDIKGDGGLGESS